MRESMVLHWMTDSSRPCSLLVLAALAYATDVVSAEDGAALAVLGGGAITLAFFVTAMVVVSKLAGGRA